LRVEGFFFFTPPSAAPRALRSSRTTHHPSCGLGFGCRVSGLRCRVSGSEVRISGFGFEVPRAAFRISLFGCRVPARNHRIFSGVECLHATIESTSPLSRLSAPPPSAAPRALRSSRTTHHPSWGLRFGVWCLGFGIWGLEVRVQGLGLRG